MDARITLAGGGHADLDALAEWLGAEAELRGRVRRDRAELSPDQMGGLSDVLLVALGSGGAITALAGAVPIWLRNRRSQLKVVISNGDGREVSIDATNIRDAEALIRQVLRDDAAS